MTSCCDCLLSPRFLHPQFQTDVTKPMLIDQIADHNVRDPLDIFGDQKSKLRYQLPYVTIWPTEIASTGGSIILILNLYPYVTGRIFEATFGAMFFGGLAGRIGYNQLRWSSLADSRYRHWVVANCNEPLTLEGLVRRRGDFLSKGMAGLGDMMLGNLGGSPFTNTHHKLLWVKPSNILRVELISSRTELSFWRIAWDSQGVSWSLVAALSIYLLLVRNVQISLRISRLLVKVGSNYTTMLFLQE